MANLTRKQRAHLDSVLKDAERALDYIMREDVAIAHRVRSASTVLDYTRKPLSADQAASIGVKQDDRALTVVTKEIGSHLCGLPTAVRSLRAFLDADAAAR